MFPAHQLLGLTHLEFAVGESRVFAAGKALSADLVQPLRIDRQSIEAFFQTLDLRGQLHAAEVLRNERVIRRADAELYCKVQAGWRLAAARYANQNNIRLGEVGCRQAIIMRQRIVQRIDTVMIIAEIAGAVRTPGRMRRRHAEFLFHRPDKNFEAVERLRVSRSHYGRQLGMNECAEYERPGPVLGALAVDPLDRSARFLNRIDERQCHFVESDALKLREKTMAEHLGRDTGAVGDEERGALGWHLWHACPGGSETLVLYLSLIHISEPTRLGMISYAVFCLK